MDLSSIVIGLIVLVVLSTIWKNGLGDIMEASTQRAVLHSDVELAIAEERARVRLTKQKVKTDDFATENGGTLFSAKELRQYRKTNGYKADAKSSKE